MLALIAPMLGGLGGCSSEAPGEPTPQLEGRRQMSVETVTLEPRPFRETLQATGTLRAREAASLQSEVAGVVTKIHFEEGQPVEAGTLLVEIDDAQWQAQHERAKARVVLADANEKRQRELLGSGDLSQATYDETAANLRVARAELALVEAELAKTRVRAPFDGIVGLREVSVGSYLSPGSPIVRIAAIDALKLDFSLPERYQELIRTGAPVRFTVSGRSGEFEGRVYAVEPVIDADTRSLLLRAEIPNPDGRLLPGAFADVELVLDDVPDALLVPAAALIPGLKRQTVYVFHDGVVEEREIEAGIRTADAVVVEKGLAPGERVVVTGLLQVRDGMAVEAVERRTGG